MQYITATDAKQNFAALIDSAQREPIMVRRQNRDAAVVISPQDYEKLRRVQIDEFQSFRRRVAAEATANGLTPEILEQLLQDET
jgi:prevent-host-death family protein